MIDCEQHNQRLETLLDATRRLMQAETHDDICDTAFLTARDILDLPFTGIWLYNDATERLEPIAVPSNVEEVVGEPPMYSAGNSLSWEAFTEGETRWYDDVTVETDVHDPTTPIRSEIILPLGDHGVINHGSTTTAKFTETDVYFAEILAATTKAALDRADRERELARQRDELATLNQINTLIQGLIRNLYGTATRDEIERTVCRHLATSDLYRAVWIGEMRGPTDEIVPREWGGIEDSTLRELTTPAAEGEDNADQAPSRRAAHTGEVHAVGDISAAPSSEPWRETAIEEGYGSVMAIPLTYGSTIYGVLVVYATQNHAFSDQIRAGFETLGGAIGFTIHAVKSEQFLLSDSVIELDVRVADPAAVIPALSEQFDCQCTLDSLIPGAGDTFLHYLKMEGVSPEGVLEWMVDIPSVENARLVGEDATGERRFEATMTESVCKMLDLARL
jgi:GAF domain-containing protein